MGAQVTQLRPACLPPVDLLYAEVIRPPNYYLQDGDFVCCQLLSVDDSSVAQLPGKIQTVVRGNFVAVVATDIQSAREAAGRLTLNWAGMPAADPLRADDGNKATVKQDSKLSNVVNREQRTDRSYGWPNRLRWGKKPSWVIADAQPETLQVWAPSPTPGLLLRDLATLLNYDTTQIQVFDASRSEGVARSCADDAAADAALLSQAVGQPVAVWLSPTYQEIATALGQAQQIYATAFWSPASGVDAFEYTLRCADNSAPVLALLLANDRVPQLQAVGVNAAVLYDFGFNNVLEPGSDVQAYRAPAQAQVQDTFARESFVDELALEMGADPVAFRRQHLYDARGCSLIESVAQQAHWATDQGRGLAPSEHQDILRGRGFAYAHSTRAGSDPEQGTRSAWIADIEVNKITGEILLNRIVVGQDSGKVIDQELLREQLQREMLDGNESLLMGLQSFDQWASEPRDAAQSDPSALVPVVDLVSPLSASTSVPAPISQTVLPLRYDADVLHPAVAVLANALHNATGIRFREPPFTADRIRVALAAPVRSRQQREKPRWRNLATAVITSSIGVLAIAWPWKGAIEPIPRPAANLYSAATIERGRMVAIAGDCVVCHTKLGGAENTGGRAFETPFGVLYSTNLTPDEETGIGSWSFTAFERAMRQGVSRDGRNLYPAFPYTAFAKISEPDMQALYAYLMAQPVTHAETPKPEMAFPFNYRPLMAGWNALFHDPKLFQPNVEKSALWNRGAYLAEGLGHCSACHSPRNAMGAEKSGSKHFAGAIVDGWEAPALNSLSKAPIPWTEDALYDYLRFGTSDLHGVAAGPMAPVVAGLAELPEQDVRAIAHYVASYANPNPTNSFDLQVQAQRLKDRAATSPSGLEIGEGIYNFACAACHEPSTFPAFTGAQTSLALNSNLHSKESDNLVQTILYGFQAKTLELPKLNSMPGFKNSLSDKQVTNLVEYLRARFAVSEPSWKNVAEKVAHYRAYEGSH
jgi:nicotinate dehydrogenase subunit B